MFLSIVSAFHHTVLGRHRPCDIDSPLQTFSILFTLSDYEGTTKSQKVHPAIQKQISSLQRVCVVTGYLIGRSELSRPVGWTITPNVSNSRNETYGGSTEVLALRMSCCCCGIMIYASAPSKKYVAQG
jgi:hypothetical protein